MPVVKFTNEKKEIEVPEGENLRKAALQAGIPLYAHVHKLLNCHGFAACGSCRVRITKGMENCSPMGMVEKIRFTCVPDHIPLAYLGNEDTMRLSCQLTVHGDIEVETKPPLNWFGENFFS
jgi:ferredoxin